jgi:hypothetical protein
VGRGVAAAVVLVICLCVVPLNAAAPVVSERRDLDTAAGAWTAPMPAGSRLEVRAVVGSIEVTRSEDGEASVTISGDGGAGLPRIELVAHDQGYTICTMYPSANPRRQNECVPGKDSRLTEGVKPDTAPVRFKVSLPANVHMTGNLMRGSISAITGPGEADYNLRTITGDLSIVDHGARHIRGEVVGGNLDAVIAASEYERTVNLNNMNGPLRVTVPNVPIRYHLSPANRVRTKLKLEAPIGSSITGSIDAASGKRLRLNLDAGVLLGYIELRRSVK